ncbi:hypothetical protein [Specibacter sp. RAF43]|uniref:hypothetical protein n=1 Tax=Specibacter sp. RAF43 TaxID=3233057 RepID=UPI003F9D5F58
MAARQLAAPRVVEISVASEKDVVHRYLRLENHYASGIILPDDLCPECARQLYCYFTNLETLEALLAEPPHDCWHRLTAITVLHAALHGPVELVETIGEEIGLHGWDRLPETDDDGDEIVY